MTFVLHQRVVLTRDIPEERLRAGDIGVVVERYSARTDLPEGYELEFFTPTGRTVAVVSVAAADIREARGEEILAVRERAATG